MRRSNFTGDMVTWLLTCLTFGMLLAHLWMHKHGRYKTEPIAVPVVHTQPVVVTYAPYKKGKIDMMTDPSEAWVDCGSNCID